MIASSYEESNPLVVYKFLEAGGRAPWGTGSWPLPKHGQRGKAITAKGELEICSNGLHGFVDLLSITSSDLYAEDLYMAELWGEVICGGNKVAARHGRLCHKVEAWNAQTQRLFAADCAERALRRFEKKFPYDKRPALAICAARQFAFSFITDQQLDAARDAARAAAWAAARDAAWDAARAAARDAAWDAARAAAWAAARDAAWAAARAAARDAARDAAWAAAWAAADWADDWAAERRWQALRLHEYLTGAVDLEAIKESVRPK